MKKTYAVVGLGKFGYHITKTLAESGVEVIACDKEEEKVRRVADFVTSAYVMDATEEKALLESGIASADTIIISIGSNIEASLLVVVQLLNLGAKELIVKAVNELHGQILEKLGVKRVVYAEKEMGIKIAKSLTMGVMEEIDFAGKYKIFEIKIPKPWIGKNLQTLDLRKKYDISVLAIKRGEKIVVNPKPEEALQASDVLLILAKESSLKKAL